MIIKIVIQSSGEKATGLDTVYMSLTDLQSRISGIVICKPELFVICCNCITLLSYVAIASRCNFKNGNFRYSPFHLSPR